MTEDWLDEKWLLEEGAAQALVDALNIHGQNNFTIVAHGDKPDIVIENKDTGERLGVEVTHLFYDSGQAKLIFGRAQGLENSPEYIDGYIERLNALLLQKAKKAKGYNHDYPLTLLIRVISPIFNSYDLSVYGSQILVPESDFIHIWLLFYDVVEKRWALLQELQPTV